MRIVQLLAGAGGMYCGACARDMALLRGLAAHGHDVFSVPLYTPLKPDDGPSAPMSGIYYGGLTVCLRQLSPVFDRLPVFLTNLLDRPRLLNLISKFAVRTQPSKLGALTVSVLAGKEGRQRKDLEQLLAFLEGRPRPEVVHLTASLLSGLAPSLKERLGAVVTCGLLGEEDFIARMAEPYRSQAHDWLRRNASAVDLYFAPSLENARAMRKYLAAPEEKVRMVRAGVDTDLFRIGETRPSRPFVIGYLGVVIPRKGLEVLAEAFARIAPRHPEAVLRVAGKVLDEPCREQVRRRLAEAGLAGRCEFLGEVDTRTKVEFYQRCNVFSQPSLFAEARGAAAVEALSCGAPLAVPDTGIFPELLEETEGGELFACGDALKLAATLERFVGDPKRAAEIGRKGALRVRRSFSAAKMVAATVDAWEELLRAKRR